MTSVPCEFCERESIPAIQVTSGNTGKEKRKEKHFWARHAEEHWCTHPAKSCLGCHLATILMLLLMLCDSRDGNCRNKLVNLVR